MTVYASMRRSALAAAAVVASSLFAIGCGQNSGGTSLADQSADGANTPVATASATSPVDRGHYIVATSGCNDCHTPWRVGANGTPEPNMELMLSGQPGDMPLPDPPQASGPWMWGGDATQTAFFGPWGISYAANLTPDSATGIGAWTEDDFIQTLRKGMVKGSGRQLMPPMPWPNLAQMTDDDLKAIYAYLRTIPPVSNKVPEPKAMPMAGSAAAAPTDTTS